MTEDIHILRLGYYNRANLMPLLYPLEAGWIAPESPWKLEIVNDVPSSLQDALLNGSLDAAFVTPAAAQLHGSKITPLGGWGLAAAGAAETALFLSPQRIDLIDGSDAAILPEAVSSSAEHILRTILSPYYDIKLNLHYADDAGYDPKGASLLYSDNAARQATTNPKGWVADDMGVAWYVLTGLPMVWELLCSHRDLHTRKPGAPEAIQALLRLSQRSAREQQSTVLQEASSRLNLPQARVKELFARQSYTLATEEQKGLAHFLDMASRAKAI